MKRSERYWKKRADQRMYEYLYDAEKDADDITRAYLKASSYLTGEAKKVLKTFARDKGVSKAEARRILERYGSDAPLSRLISQVSDPEQKRQLKEYLDAPAYAYRIRRLEELREDIGRQCRELYGVTDTGIEHILTNTAKKACSRTMFDIQKGVGYGFAFSEMPAARIDEILRQNWSGEHYSRRIWNNTQKLAETVREEVMIGFMSGRSVGETADAIQQRMGCGSMEARRLARTETNYVANQAELDSYRKCGIEQYEFSATLDSRTSEICRRLDGKRFPVSRAQAGVNLPPMHPNCRSTTVAAFDDEDEDGMMRRARNPVTGESELVPADMTYEEWEKKYVQPEKELKVQTDHGILKEKEIVQYPITDEAIQSVPAVLSVFVSKDQLLESHKDLLRFVENEPLGTEAAAYYDQNMKLLDRYIGSDSSVKAEHFDVPYLVMHNHPSGETFTHTDIERFIMDPDMIVLTAVGNNGNVYMLEKLDNYNAAGLVTEYHSSNLWNIENVTAAKYLKQMNEFLNGVGKYGVKYTVGR